LIYFQKKDKISVYAFHGFDGRGAREFKTKSKRRGSSDNSGQKLGAMRRLGVRNGSFCIPELIYKDIISFIEIL
jgi:hypothetical protein